ncbi:MAG TPA: metallophosphoesterase [Acetobacteraceae bacterium]|nr:metallophosphoesterase [Acetobacteraceae bacterium]
MQPILDPRAGDIEDDASSTKRRSLLSLAGTLLGEISLPKLAIAWMMLIGFPGLMLGAAPLLVSLWIASVSSHAAVIFTEVMPVLVLLALAVLGWFAWRPLLRLAESSFWSLNALAVQPAYVAFREGFRHLAERLLASWMSEDRRVFVRAASAAASGLVICGLGLGLIRLAWSATRWVGSLQDIASPARLVPVVLANSIVLISGYFALAAMVWGWADTTMAQPRDLRAFAAGLASGRRWRVAHLSDIHTVGERYGFRVESGRSGPRGNERLRQVLRRLDEIHAAHPLDVILITGDLTDAGRSAEWAEFFAALAPYPELAELVVALPGNHDVNVVNRASPARLELPTSPLKRLRQLRTLSALAMLQGTRLRIVERAAGRLGSTLADAIAPHAADMISFADDGSARRSSSLAGLWDASFPLVRPPDTDDGLGIVVLNSNAETHFSFTNALGLVSAEQTRRLEIAARQYPRACWIVALHHHVIEYPKPVKALSERIGTALINGSWFVRRLRRLADHVVIMHGHRHVDWIGECGGVLIVSAPSPVMEATDCMETYFYVHNLAVAADGRLSLLEPERINVSGRALAESAAAA